MLSKLKKYQEYCFMPVRYSVKVFGRRRLHLPSTGLEWQGPKMQVTSIIKAVIMNSMKKVRKMSKKYFQLTLQVVSQIKAKTPYFWEQIL